MYFNPFLLAYAAIITIWNLDIIFLGEIDYIGIYGLTLAYVGLIGKFLFVGF